MPLKKSSKARVKSPAEILESEIRLTIERCTALVGLSEIDHFKAVDEALCLISTGVEMRLDELEPDEFGM